MMQNKSYAKQVDRRLSAMHFLLSTIEDPAVTSLPVARVAIIESAIFQFYFALISYLNEVLSYYRKKSLDVGQFNLGVLLAETNTVFDGISEIVELKQWSNKNGDVFSVMSDFPLTLVTLSSIASDVENKKLGAQPIKASTMSMKTVSLIDVGSESANKCELNDLQSLKKLLDGFRYIIDSQRHNQAEY